MATLGELKTAIASELAEGGLAAASSIISDAINQAILDYQDEPFYFNEETDSTTIDTVNGTQSYALPTDNLDIIMAQITAGGRTYTMMPISFVELQELTAASNSLASYPDRYSIFNQRIYLYPIPNGAYDVTLHQRYALSAPATDGASNAWTVDGLELVKQRAKAIVCSGRLKRFDDAMAFQTMADAQKERLLRKTRKMTTSGNVTRVDP